MPVTVSDVRQHVYCPRIPFFRVGMRLSRPLTYTMQESKLEHERVEELEERCSLRAYSLTEGERLFNLHLASERLGLSGKLDLLIRPWHELIPVESKNCEGSLGLNHKYQLVAYALLVEEHFARPVQRIFLYFIPQKRAQRVPITPGMRCYVHRILNDI